MSNIKVVIFSPHSHCVAKTRDCDKRARVSAQKIYGKLLKHGVKPSDITYIKHEVLRSDYDLNRFPSRGTEPRKQLREIIYKLYDDMTIDRIYLLEMHSFPDGWEIPIKGRDIVVLNRALNREVGKALVDHLGGEAERVELHIGSELCDIQTEFTPGRDAVVPFLIEISEDTTSFPEEKLDKKLDQIADFVARDLAAPVVEGLDVHSNVVDDIGNSMLSKWQHHARHILIIALIIAMIIIIILFMRSFSSSFAPTFQSILIATALIPFGTIGLLAFSGGK